MEDGGSKNWKRKKNGWYAYCKGVTLRKQKNINKYNVQIR